MHISATIKNGGEKNTVTVSTESNQKTIDIPSKGKGLGSSINGGELLFPSLATCFCNDVYREAAKRNLPINNVEVTLQGRFGKEGEPASDITYHVNVNANCSPEEVTSLITYVDQIAEVHNTLRTGVPVILK